MLVHLSSTFVLLFSLLTVDVSSQSCDKEITVDVTSSGNLVLPIVQRVYLISSPLSGDITWTVDNDSGDSVTVTADTYSIDVNSSYLFGDNYTVTSGDTTFHIGLTYDPDEITCQNLTLNVGFSDGSNLNFTCIPVSSCRSNDTFSSITWKKSFYLDGSYQVLDSGPYLAPQMTQLRNYTDRNIISLSDMTVGNAVIADAVLDIGNPNINSVGYYLVYGNMTLLHNFTVFSPLRRVSSPESLIVIKGTKDPYRGVHCVFEAFPSATVTWTRGSNMESAESFDGTSGIQFLNIVESDTDSNYTEVNDGVIEFTYTINGGIEFKKLEYDDAGFYYCSASNEYDSYETHVRLRVRDPLRPLWPALGIIAVFIITALFIVVGAIGDKIREDRSSSLDPNDVNAAFSSPYAQRASVTDDDVSPKRRTSSTMRLLPSIKS